MVDERFSDGRPFKLLRIERGVLAEEPTHSTPYLISGSQMGWWTYKAMIYKNRRAMRLTRKDLGVRDIAYLKAKGHVPPVRVYPKDPS
jgi:hypothetical protein